MGMDRRPGDWRYAKAAAEADRLGLRGEQRKRYIFGTMRTMGWEHPREVQRRRRRGLLSRILGR